MDEKRRQGHFDEAELRRAHRGYYGMVSEVDYHVGRMLDALEESGLADNTIVVFTSDHGEWLGEHLRYGKGYPGHDVVSRVPLLIRMPGGANGRRVEHLVEGVDVVPTLLEACGVPVPPHLQGQSLFSILNGSNEEVRESAMMEFTGWKMIRTQHFRYVAHGDGREFLYDLREQWGEYRDVLGSERYEIELAVHRHLLLQRVINQEQPLDRVWNY